MHPSTARADPGIDLPPPPTGLTGISLFFDLDGTLIEIAATPDGVVVEPAMLADLASLADRLPGRVAVVSGRSLQQIDRLLGDVVHKVALAGSHGAEQRLPATDAPMAIRPPALDAVTQHLSAFAETHGLVLERKTVGTALHFRQRPGMEGETVALGQRLAEEHGLVLQRGKMMVEVRADGDKGRAIAALLQTPAMAGTRPLFFGDDVTDEDGFVAAAAAGGAGVLVGEPHPTAARYGLESVSALHAWIDTALKGAA